MIEGLGNEVLHYLVFKQDQENSKSGKHWQAVSVKDSHSLAERRCVAVSVSVLHYGPEQPRIHI